MHGEDAPKRDTEQLWYTLHETEWLKTEAFGGPLLTAGIPGGINKEASHHFLKNLLSNQTWVYCRKKYQHYGRQRKPPLLALMTSDQLLWSHMSWRCWGDCLLLDLACKWSLQFACQSLVGVGDTVIYLLQHAHSSPGWYWWHCENHVLRFFFQDPKQIFVLYLNTGVVMYY